MDNQQEQVLDSSREQKQSIFTYVAFFDLMMDLSKQ